MNVAKFIRLVCGVVLVGGWLLVSTQTSSAASEDLLARARRLAVVLGLQQEQTEAEIRTAIVQGMQSGQSESGILDVLEDLTNRVSGNTDLNGQQNGDGEPSPPPAPPEEPPGQEFEPPGPPFEPPGPPFEPPGPPPCVPPAHCSPFEPPGQGGN